MNYIRKRISTVSNRLLLIFGTLLCGTLVVGCGHHSPSPTDVSAMANVPSNFTVAGTVDTTMRMIIASPNQGILGAVMGEDGKAVASGQTVARLNSPDALIRLELARRKLAVLMRERRMMLANAGAPVGTSSGSQRENRQMDILAARVQMQYAKAELDNAQANYNSKVDLRTGVTGADMAVQVAQQQVDASSAALSAAESMLTMQENQHDAVKRLVNEQAASPEELRTAMENLQQATASVDQARFAYNRDKLSLWVARQSEADAKGRASNPFALRSALLDAESKYAQSVVAYRRAVQGQGPVSQAQTQSSVDTSGIDSDIVSAQGEYVLAEQGVKALNIVSPMAGTLFDWQAEVGQTVQPGQALGSVVNLTHLKVTVNVRPEIATYMMPGNLVNVVVLVPTKKIFVGRISATSPIVDPTTGKQQITILVDDPTHTLQPGSSVDVQTRKL